MFPPELIFKYLTETWDQASRTLFRDFLAANPGVTRWIISSDYCLRDNTRPNDCFAFSIIPFEDNLSDIQARIRAALPKDIKNTRYLPQAAVDLLTDPRTFHLVIVVPKDRDVFNNGPGSDPLEISRDVARLTLEAARDMERGDNTIRPLKKMVQESRAKRFKFERYGDLLLLGFFFPFVSLLINRERKAEALGWMSDRDNMTTWGDGVIWNNATESFRGLGERLGIGVDGTRVEIAVPASQSGPMWHDEMIRPPDFLAGTMAAWNTTTDEFPPGRKSLVFEQVRDHVFASARNAVVLWMDIGGNGLQWGRWGIELPSGREKVPLGPAVTSSATRPHGSSAP